MSNYDFLFRLYGLVPGARDYDAPTAAPSFQPLPTFAPVGQLEGVSQQEETPGNRGNKGRDNGKKRSLKTLDEELQASLVDARERIMSGKREGVRAVYRGNREEIHEADMAHGHKLRVHKLLPIAR